MRPAFLSNYSNNKKRCSQAHLFLFSIQFPTKISLTNFMWFDKPKFFLKKNILAYQIYVYHTK